MQTNFYSSSLTKSEKSFSKFIRRDRVYNTIKKSDDGSLLGHKVDTVNKYSIKNLTAAVKVAGKKIQMVTTDFADSRVTQIKVKTDDGLDFVVKCDLTALRNYHTVRVKRSLVEDTSTVSPSDQKGLATLFASYGLDSQRKSKIGQVALDRYSTSPTGIGAYIERLFVVLFATRHSGNTLNYTWDTRSGQSAVPPLNVQADILAAWADAPDDTCPILLPLRDSGKMRIANTDETVWKILANIHRTGCGADQIWGGLTAYFAPYNQVIPTLLFMASKNYVQVTNVVGPLNGPLPGGALANVERSIMRAIGVLASYCKDDAELLKAYDAATRRTCIMFGPRQMHLSIPKNRIIINWADNYVIYQNIQPIVNLMYLSRIAGAPVSFAPHYGVVQALGAVYNANMGDARPRANLTDRQTRFLRLVITQPTIWAALLTGAQLGEAMRNWTVDDTCFLFAFIQGSGVTGMVRALPTQGTYLVPVVAVPNYTVAQTECGRGVDRSGALPIFNQYEKAEVELTHYVASFIGLRGMHSFVSTCTLNPGNAPNLIDTFVSGWQVLNMQRRLCVDTLAQFVGYNVFSWSIEVQKLPNGGEWEIDEDFFDDNETAYNKVLNVPTTFLARSSVPFTNMHSSVPFDPKDVVRWVSGDIAEDYEGDLETAVLVVCPTAALSRLFPGICAFGGIINPRETLDVGRGRNGNLNYTWKRDDLFPREYAGAHQLALFMNGQNHRIQSDMSLVVEGEFKNRRIVESSFMRMSDCAVNNVLFALPVAWGHAAHLPVLWTYSPFDAEFVVLAAFSNRPTYTTLDGGFNDLSGDSIRLAKGVGVDTVSCSRMYKVPLFRDIGTRLLRGAVVIKTAKSNDWKVPTHWSTECSTADLFPVTFTKTERDGADYLDAMPKNIALFGTSCFIMQTKEGEELLKSAFLKE